MEVIAKLLLTVLALGAVVQCQDLSRSSSALRSQSEDANFNPRRVARQSSDRNKLVDAILQQFKDQILAQNEDEVPLPDIRKTFPKSVSFEATDGFLKSISSIQRMGDVSYSSNSNQSETLTAHLGFGTLHFGYKHYVTKLLWGVGPRGEINARVEKNSVRLRVQLNVMDDSTCKLTLVEAKVVELKGFDVKVKGLGPLNWLASKIITWVVTSMRHDIAIDVGRLFESELTQLFAKTVIDCTQ